MKKNIDNSINKENQHTMCAGKLLSLIKKCLSRDRYRSRNTNGTRTGSTNGNRQDKKNCCDSYSAKGSCGKNDKSKSAKKSVGYCHYCDICTCSACPILHPLYDQSTTICERNGTTAASDHRKVTSSHRKNQYKRQNCQCYCRHHGHHDDFHQRYIYYCHQSDHSHLVQNHPSGCQHQYLQNNNHCNDLEAFQHLCRDNDCGDSSTAPLSATGSSNVNGTDEMQPSVFPCSLCCGCYCDSSVGLVLDSDSTSFNTSSTVSSPMSQLFSSVSLSSSPQLNSTVDEYRRLNTAPVDSDSLTNNNNRFRKGDILTTNTKPSAFRFPPPFGDPVQHVVYVPQTGHTNSRLHQPQAHRHMSNSSHDVDSDTTNLPPQICISLDGEEGYVNSQHKLQQPSIVSQEMVNPPPNRTVFQGEEIPPPYRAYSVGQLDKSKLMSSGRPKAGRDCTSSPCVPYSHPHYCSAAAAAAFYSCSHSGINNNNISNCNKKLCLNNNGNNNGFTHNGHPSPSIPPTLPKQQQQKKQRQQSSRSEGEQYSSSYSKTAGSLLDSSYQKQLKFDLQDQLQQPLTTCNHNTHHPPSNPRSACLYSAAPPVGQDRRSHQRYPTQQPHNHHHQHQQRNNRTVSGSTSSGNSSSNTAGLPSYSSNSPPYDCTELSDTDVFCSDVNSGDIVHSTGGVVATGVSELRPSPDAS